MSEEHYSMTRQERLTRRGFMQIAAATAGTAFLAACGSTTTTQPVSVTAVATNNPQSVAATTTAAVGKTYFPSGLPNVADAFTAPLPAYQSVFYVPGNGETINSFAITSDPPVTAKSQNKFWQAAEKKLNITWNLNSVTSDVYPEKVGTLLASGNLPDIFMIDTGYAPSLFAAIQQGAFTDLTPLYGSSSFATDYPNLAKLSQLSWQNSRINGKHYTIPRPRPLTGEAFLYRKDWADKAGVSNPQTADDLLKMFKAFAKQNLDGGGSQTWAINFSSGVFASSYQGQGAFFFNIFGAPNQWRKNADGSLTHLIETDEFKQGLSFLNQMYKAGLIYPNAFAQTGQDVKDGFSAGKYGVYMDTITGVPDQTTNLNKVHPTGVLSVLTPFGANGATANHWLGKGFNAAAGIPSSTGSDANKLKVVLRVLDYLAAPAFSIESNFMQLGVDGWDNTVTNGVQVQTPVGSNEIPGLFNQANGNTTFYYPHQLAINPNLAVQNQGFTANLIKIGLQDPTLGLYSPTFIKQGAVLAKLIDDRATRIVTGNAPLSSVSDLISSWKVQGGTLMAKEYATAGK